MKNAIIAALGTYIYYGFCVEKSIVIPIIVFFLFWALVEEIDEDIKDFKRKVKRGERLSKIIDTMKGA